MSTPTQHPLVSTLDDLSSPQLRVGENGHIEHGWSDKFVESVVQFHFQLVRIDKNDKKTLMSLAQKLRQILFGFKAEVEKNHISFSPDAFDENSVAFRKKNMPMFYGLYRMIGHTRDIIMGKGEYTLAYLQIAVWYEFYPEAAMYALERCVHPPPCDYEIEKQGSSKSNSHSHQYGSWKDIKYFCQFLMDNHTLFKFKEEMTPEHPLIDRALKLMVHQIKDDEGMHKAFFITSTDIKKVNVSLAARWAPRASSKKFGWMFNKLATMYFQNYLDTATSEESRRRAVLKAKTRFRKLLSQLNRFLDTTQVKQCDPTGRWSDIIHNTVTSITARKQKKAFQYVNKMGVSRQREKPNRDREECAKRYSAHVAAAVAGDKSHKIRGKRVGLGELVKDAIKNLEHINYTDPTTSPSKQLIEERNVINLQWEDNKKQNSKLGNMIACVDTSGSMTCDNSVPLYNAIGLGIRIAENSALGKRLSTFSATPSWVNLDDCSEFTECVEKIRRSNWGFNTNFHALLEMVLDAIKTAKLPIKDVQNLILCILSDMQIDDSQVQENNDTMFELMKRRYHDVGLELYGQPIRPPHIVFWNLRTTNGFPTLTNEKNTTMMSGFSPVLLNAFVEKGMDALDEFTPETMLFEILNKPRYDCLEKKMRQILTFQDKDGCPIVGQATDDILFDAKHI